MNKRILISPLKRGVYKPQPPPINKNTEKDVEIFIKTSTFAHSNNLKKKTMYTIQTNASGTRSMEISEVNLQTIQKYSLFQHLIDSNGIVDEMVLDKLKLNIRSLIASAEGNCKDLLDLCIDVIYHNNMKAFGLHQLILLYIKWEKELEENKAEEVTEA